MKPDEHIRRWHDEFTAIRRDLHAHPELGFEEHRTARVVQETLARFGIEHHSGIGKTGIVAVIRGTRNASGRSIGLRADMDALPMVEENEFAHKSRYEGRMHGCGHDGHTTMLLAAARYLQETRNFDGTAYLIFQPGEEGYAGAKAMIEDGLFERFPGRAGVRAAQLAGIAARPHRHHARLRDGGGGPHRDHDRRPRRSRRPSAHGRSIRCWSPDTSSPRRSRSSAAT